MDDAGSSVTSKIMLFDNATLTTAERLDAITRAYGELDASLQDLKVNMDHFFMIICSFLITFMQAGFAFLEAGCIRAKNTTNILLKNYLDTFIAGVTFFLFGRAFSFESGNKFIGLTDFMSLNMRPEKYSKFFFEFCFTSTAASIVAGSVVERVTFVSYLVYTTVTSGLIFPIVAHWAWSPDGWLVNTPFRDFGGSGILHLVGGAVALMACLILGPRSDLMHPVTGRRRLIRGHSTPLAALGGFILTLGFLGFNCASLGHVTHKGDGLIIANSVVCTLMSASAGGLTGMFLFRMGLFVNRNIEEKAWSLMVTINSAFIAMVASCGGCDSITPWGAILVGVVAAVIFLGIRRLTTKFDLLDDPLDCVAVHFGGGWWGLISAGLLSERGLVSGDSSMLKWNFGAGLCITLWSFATSGLLFFILRLFGVLRVTLDNEYKGADIVKHKEPAYTPFAYGSGPYEDQARPLPTEQKVSRADDLKGKWQNSDASENNRVLARSRYPMHLINNSDGIEPINRSPTSRKESASNPYAAARLEDDMLKFFEDKLKKHHCCQTDACNCHLEYKELNDDLRN